MGSAINLDDIKRYEVTEVYSHPDAKVDIVLVHGLNGNPRNTWTAPNGVFWPSQLLPASLKSFQARILVYGYNADVYTFGSSKGGPSSDMIHQHAQTLLANLALERKSEEVAEHPIIWVAHSLGGILVKRALELSFDLQGNHDDDLRSIFVSTFGVIFLGTPHTGADPAKWGLILQGMVNTMVPKKLFETHSQLVKTLQSNNEILQNINLRFLDLYPNRLRICMVHEGHPTDLKGTKHLIVDQTAASPQLPDVQYFGIEATHSGMCKFESKNAPGFTNVSVTLRSWVQECPEFIRTRWDVERLLRKQKREDEIAQLQRLSGLLPSTPHMTSTPNTPEPGSVYSSMVIAKSTISIAPEDPAQDAPYFIKPSGFRPNSLFVGREAELELMHKMLFDKKRRADGTSAVLLQSLPGGGKTHLARQYVYNHKDDFPGGIFWLRAKSETELAAGFWDIARKAALKHLVGTEEAGSKEDPEQFIKMVRKWLDKRHDWLIVLDGIHFSHSTLRKFIPDSTNTSIIYTSTEKSVIGDHHFMNPQLIRLPLLSAREAQRLLLLELGRTEPFAKDDLRYSMELVQSMGFLPVVIHAVAQRLKTTDEPLSKFARTYSSEPRLRGLGTYIAVVEQLKGLGAKEALNLINILCFFSQHIPVEMISLGLRSLPPTISVKAHEPVSGNSLNNTFKILNRFALIDRNDHDNDTDRDKDPAASSHSQTSKRSRDMLADNVDVIRLHSVVQGFFLDTLSADGSLLLWLDLATRLFCCSYDMANERISRKTHAGLVEDYRLYEIHGNKLSEHLAKHLSKRLSPRQKEILHEADDMLAQRLVSVKNEIDRRTPESSSVIVAVAGGGKQEVFQTSIFDRTSSSSDTGPETPGKYDGLHSGIGISTWGMESEKSQFESPVREKDFGRRVEGDGVSIYQQQPQQPQQPHFPFPLAMPEDPGYESDREEVNAYTMSSPLPLPITSSSPPSQRPISSDTNASPKWETMPPRNQRQRPRPRPIPNPLYRTLPSALSPTRRNKDLDFHTVSAGAIVPHVSHDHAKGFLQSGSDGLGNGSGKGGLRAQSRGRLSGQSGAEVSLAHLRRNSPLSPRGGGTIGGLERGGGGSRRGSEAVERGRIMMTGLSSYAAAVVKGSTRDTVEGLRGLVGLGDGEADGDGGREGDSAVVDDDNDADAESGTADVHGGGSGREQYQERPHISALESLQKIPIRHSDNPVLMPPYPPSPSGTPAPGFVLDEGRDGNGNVFAAQDTENIYPRREGYPPLEHLSSSITKSNENDYRRLSPKPINHPQKSSHRQRNTQSESLPASLLFSRSNLEDSYAGGLGGRIHPSTSETNLDLMSLSYPGLREQRRLSNSGSTSSGVGPYYPGRPELSNLELERGYESLPMSRDPSGLSGLSGQSADSGRGNGVGRSGRGRGRRGSVAETEPDLGSRLRELGFESRRERAIEGKGNGNRLEFARAALIESLDEWGQGGENSPPTQSQRTQSTPPQLKGQLKPSPNLTAPFSPSPSQGSGMVNSFASYTSPYPPDNTPDLGWNGGAGSQKPSPSQRYLSPNPNSRSSPRTSPHYNIQQKASPRTSPPLSSPNLGGERMDRHSSGSGSGSGGVRIRGRNGSEAGGRETGMDRMITFGDYPEPVDVEYVLAPEREWERERPGVLRSWGERERVERHRREETRGKGVSEREEVGLGISGGVVELEGRGGG